MADILRKAVSGLSPAKAKVMAVVLLHMLKGVISTANEAPAVQVMILAEIRELVRTYLAPASGAVVRTLT